MSTFFISALVIAMVMAAMAVGVLMGRAPIKGSCGGMGALGVDTACDLCGGDPKRCDEETRDGKADDKATDLFYSADNRK